jgi:polysaccharide export outer membrane protein
MNLRWPVCLCALLTALLTACETSRGPVFDARQSNGKDATNFMAVPPSQTLRSEWLQSPTNLFTLGPGDRVEIEVLGDATTRSVTVVGPDGKIYYYLLPGLDVWGLTLATAKERIEQALAQYFQQPQKVLLTLRGVESKQVWILGRVSKPGIYPLATPMTLVEALSLAGGPATVMPVALQSGGAVSTTTDEVADLRRSFVLRKGQLLPVDFHRLLHEGDLSHNVYLQADDFVYLPSATSREVYVLGAVGQPRAVSFGEELNLISAVANAGGTVKDAYLSHVAIVRGSLTKPKIAVVDYKAVVRAQAPNVLLEPRDIVFVPFTPYRTLARYTDMILSTFVRTVGVNEGARAVSGGTVPIGITVTP